MELPKVLIINQPFNSHTGGGVTLANLFAGWQKDKIAVVCYHYLLSEVDTDICDTYYQIGADEHKFIFPFHLLKKGHSSGVIDSKRKKLYAATYQKLKLRDRIIMNYFNPILKYLGVYNRISKLELSDKLRNWMDEFAPDIIYAQAPARESMEFISLIHDYVRKPLIFHMMDDWILADKGPLKNIERKKNERAFKAIMDRAEVLISVSEGMANAYKVRYNKSFVIFHNPVDIDFWKIFQKHDYKLNDIPVILYAGRIGLGIDTSLKLVAKAVQKLTDQQGRQMRFILQTKDKPAWVQEFACVEHKGFVPYNELPKAFSEADMLILPYDFSAQALKFIRYSMPTKATEYMITGTPIIVFAPEETAIVYDALKYGWAEVVVQNDMDSLVKTISKLSKDESARRTLSQKAIKHAEENHEAKRVRERFRDILFSLAAKNK